MSELFSQIRARRQLSVEQASAMLALVALADTASKQGLLSSAARSLNEPAIAGKWIEVALAESDTRLRGSMLLQLGRLDYRQIPEAASYLDLLIWGLTQDDLRLAAMKTLGGLAATHPEVMELLLRTYSQQRTASAQRQILIALLQFDTPTPALAEFFQSVLARVDADLKIQIVRKLLHIDALSTETIDSWLQGAEPSDLKLLLLSYAVDRSLPVESGALHVLAQQDHAECRLAAIRALAAQTVKSIDVVRGLLKSAQKDASTEVRAACLLCFRHSLDLTPEAQVALLEELNTETSRPTVLMILDLLTPYLGQSAVIRDKLLAWLQENPHVEIAEVIYERLGRLAAWDQQLFEKLAQAYEESKNDRICGVILRTLSLGQQPEEKLLRFYVEALHAPSTALKTWGARGLLMLPLTPENATAIAAGADLLLDPSLDVRLLHSIARKVGRIVEMTPETLSRLKQVVEQSQQGALKAICQEAIERAQQRTELSAESVDFEHWFHQVEVDHAVDGIFPAIYSLYDQSPEMSRRIMKVALLNPACSDSMYSCGVCDAHIVQFLMSRNALDQDIDRYCVDFLLHKGESYGNPNLFLAALRMSPSFFPELQPSLWLLFQTKRNVAQCNQVLLRQILVEVHGNEEVAGAAFAEHLSQQNSVIGAAPYLHFLLNNLLWPPSRSLLKQALEKPAILDDEVRKQIQTALRPFGDAKVEKSPLPGLADD
jgi:hypothetical protein